MPSLFRAGALISVISPRARKRLAGGIGRTGFPGGDQDIRVASIRQRLLPVGNETMLMPGQGRKARSAKSGATVRKGRTAEDCALVGRLHVRGTATAPLRFRRRHREHGQQAATVTRADFTAEVTS